jgi:methionyl aminopeptidase
MSDGATIAPARDARNHRGASRALRGGTAVSPRNPIMLRSEAEIEAIAQAGAVLARALEVARSCCVAGATTSGIERAVRDSIAGQGGAPLFLGYRGSATSSLGLRPAFPAAACVSVNEELVHGVPGTRVLADGDLVSIDAGVSLDGWCADSAISVCVGDSCPDSMRLIDCAERMLEHAVSAIRPGLRWSMIAREIEAIAVADGLSVAVDFVGHGIGRALHEAPQVPCSVYSSFLESGDFTLRPGMVLAIEPMVVAEPTRRDARGELVNPKTTLAADGWTVTVDSAARSAHAEHTVAVTRDGAVVLTRSQRNLRTQSHRAMLAG